MLGNVIDTVRVLAKCLRLTYRYVLFAKLTFCYLACTAFRNIPTNHGTLHYFHSKL